MFCPDLKLVLVPDLRCCGIYYRKPLIPDEHSGAKYKSGYTFIASSCADLILYNLSLLEFS